MSYTYLRERGAEFSVECFSDIVPSARWRLSLTVGGSCCSGSGTEFSPGSQSGTTCGLSTAARGRVSLTLSAAGSRARTSARPARVLELMEREADSGGRWRELSVRFDRVSSSWRTHQCLFDEVLPESSVILPRWGMIRRGVCWERMTAARHTRGSGSGFWPTPTVHGNNNRKGLGAKSGTGLATAAKLWTTPCASDGRRGGKITKNMTGTSLAQQVKTPEKWPTPRASDGKRMGTAPKDWKRGKGTGNRLRDFIHLCPTPTVQDAKNNGGPSQSQRNTPPLNAVAGGALNPPWVEWLMGWPIGWTGLQPLAMDRFRTWCSWRGVNL